MKFSIYLIRRVSIMFSFYILFVFSLNIMICVGSVWHFGLRGWEKGAGRFAFRYFVKCVLAILLPFRHHLERRFFFFFFFFFFLLDVLF